MNMTNIAYSEIFNEYARTTDEKEKIISILKEFNSGRFKGNNYCLVDDNTKILDIGGADAKISKALQRNDCNITLVDVMDYNAKYVKFIKGKFEDVEISGKYDVLIASHVWTYFEGKSSEAFDKMLKLANPGARLVFVYNTHEGFFEKFRRKMHQEIPGVRMGSFDRELIEDNLHLFNKVTDVYFHTVLKARGFIDLTCLSEMFLELDEPLVPKDPKYGFSEDKWKIHRYLTSHLLKPEFVIEQKVTVVELT
jgi:hypothetical protein